MRWVDGHVRRPGGQLMKNTRHAVFLAPTSAPGTKSKAAPSTSIRTSRVSQWLLRSILLVGVISVPLRTISPLYGRSVQSVWTCWIVELLSRLVRGSGGISLLFVIPLAASALSFSSSLTRLVLARGGCTSWRRVARSCCRRATKQPFSRLFIFPLPLLTVFESYRLPFLEGWLTRLVGVLI